MLLITGVFLYAVIDRILHFYDRPVYIDLQVGYMDEVDFPAVAICNQNPYRQLLFTYLQRSSSIISVHLYEIKFEMFITEPLRLLLQV